MTTPAAGAGDGWPAVDRKKIGIVWLHGLGDSGRSWHGLQQRVWQGLHVVDDAWAQNVSPEKQIKWRFPEAPAQKVRLNQDMEMPSWFDMYSIPARATDAGTGADADAGEQDAELRAQLDRSVALVHAEIDSLRTDDHVAPERIFVCGFSQGAAVAVLAALSYGRGRGSAAPRVAGVAAFSGWAVGPLAYWDERVVAVTESGGTAAGGGASGNAVDGTGDAGALPPALVCHGADDDIVEPGAARALRDRLRAAVAARGGAEVRCHTYPRMGHVFSADEERDLCIFIRDVGAAWGADASE